VAIAAIVEIQYPRLAPPKEHVPQVKIGMNQPHAVRSTVHLVHRLARPFGHLEAVAA